MGDEPVGALAEESLEVAAGGESEYTPRAVRRGWAICLSGGGFRAALFHLGALRRLHELGILTRIDTVSSVSGGSILAAHLASVLRSLPSGQGFSWAAFAEEFREFTRRDIRTRPILARLKPWNWFSPGVQAEALAEQYQNHLLKKEFRFRDLPARPNFIFGATDMAFGVNWIFEKSRAGDYQAGYLRPDGWPVAKAAAASSCFPPVFNPMPLGLAPRDLTGGKCPAGPERDELVTRIALTDGGVYDNMGLEPVWKDHALLLVSDGGAPFRFTTKTNPFSNTLRFADIVGSQAIKVRKRWLIAGYEKKVMQGTYWGIGGATERYKDCQVEGYSKELARDVISCIRTDLDAFSEAEFCVLENHGYALAEAALGTHLPHVMPDPAAPFKLPHPEWTDENRVRRELRDSGRRAWFGREG